MKFIKDHLLNQKAKSREHFFQLLMNNGFSITYHRGIPIGIRDTNGKQYSWDKLNIKTTDFHALDQKAQFHRIDEGLQKLEQLRTNQQYERDINP